MERDLTTTDVNQVINVNGLLIDDIVKCLDLIEERLTWSKPYKTLEGCLNDINGLNTIETALHEFETGYEDILNHVWSLQNQLRIEKHKIIYWKQIADRLAR